MDYIKEFRNEYFFLSNFYEVPVTYDGLTFQNNEAAFQAQKTLDLSKRKEFTTMNASEAKKAGRQLTLRKDWETIKVGIMRELVFAKFNQNPMLAEKLRATGNAYLEEGNTWGDRIWGTVNGQGSNQLGKILMEQRELFQEMEKNSKEMIQID